MIVGFLVDLLSSCTCSYFGALGIALGSRLVVGVQEQTNQKMPVTSQLLTRSNLPKKCRFNNTQNHRYLLRSLTRGTNFKSKAVDYLTAQHLFQSFFQPTIHHTFDSSGRRETIDFICAGSNKDVWHFF